jgi:Kdo2-lipid IVA lauroyltransferase/acyltransferase
MGKYDDTRTNQLRGRLAAAGLRLIGALPLSWNRAFGVMVGWLAWRIGGKSRRITEINIDLCFPGRSERARAQLVRESMVETGKGASETALCWLKPHQALSRVVAVDGDAPLRATLDSGSPVVVLAPHLGCWEIVNFWLSSQFELHAMFKPSHFQAVNDLVLQSREHFNGTFYPASARGVAGLMRALKSGPVITGILPDQVPDERGGRFAPFFGHPALTGTLPVKLIQQSGARAFLMFAKRLPGTAGYSLIIREADPAIYDADIDTALTAMNRSVEALVREAPEQYVWNYKRFRRQTDGWKNPYRP